MGDASSLPRSRAGIDRVGVACGGREVAGVSPGLEAFVHAEILFGAGGEEGLRVVRDGCAARVESRGSLCIA